jgi:hypothetical protein
VPTIVTIDSESTGVEHSASAWVFAAITKSVMVCAIIAAIVLVCLQLPSSAKNGAPILQGPLIRLLTVLLFGISGAIIRMLAGPNVTKLVRGLHEPGAPMAAAFQMLIGALAAIVVYVALLDHWLLFILSGTSHADTAKPDTLTGTIFAGLLGGLSAPDVFGRFSKGS